MKKISFYFLVGVITACSPNPYLLSERNKYDKNYLNYHIQRLAKEQTIGAKPLLVIDGKEHDSKSGNLSLTRVEIESLSHLTRAEGEHLYGAKGKQGVVVVRTVAAENQIASIKEPNTLYLIGDKRVNEADVKALTSDQIESVDIIDDLSQLSHYIVGDEEYVGAIVIHLKSSQNDEQKQPILIQTAVIDHKFASYTASSILYLIENKKSTEAEVKALKPGRIQSVEVINDLSGLRHYMVGDEKYSGAVIVRLKSPNDSGIPIQIKNYPIEITEPAKD